MVLTVSYISSFGKGNVYYICADFEQGFYDEVYEKIAASAGVEKALPVIPEGVEVTIRHSDTHQYLFVQNFNRQKVQMALPVDKMEALFGTYRNGTVGSWETIVLKGK